MKNKLLIVGGGKMGFAIAKGVINSSLKKDEIVIAESSVEHSNKLKESLGCQVINNPNEIKEAEIVLFAVKPFVADEVMALYKNHNFQYITSVMAGIDINNIANIFHNKKIARIMPNTPCLIGKGLCSYVLIKEDKQFDLIINKILSPIAKVIKLKNEKELAISMAVAASGPGFVYYFAKIFIDYAIENGLDPIIADEIVRQNFLGSGLMLGEFNYETIDKLISDVATKGGVTLAGIDSFKENHLQEVLFKGLASCVNRSYELIKK